MQASCAAHAPYETFSFDNPTLQVGAVPSSLNPDAASFVPAVIDDTDSCASDGGVDRSSDFDGQAATATGPVVDVEQHNFPWNPWLFLDVEDAAHVSQCCVNSLQLIMEKTPLFHDCNVPILSGSTDAAMRHDCLAPSSNDLSCQEGQFDDDDAIVPEDQKSLHGKVADQFQTPIDELPEFSSEQVHCIIDMTVAETTSRARVPEGYFSDVAVKLKQAFPFAEGSAEGEETPGAHCRDVPRSIVWRAEEGRKIDTLTRI